MTPDDFVDLAHQLRDLGVAEFWYADYHVKFRPDALVPKEVEAREDKPAPKKDLRQITADAFGHINFPGNS